MLNKAQMQVGFVSCLIVYELFFFSPVFPFIYGLSAVLNLNSSGYVESFITAIFLFEP